MYEKPTQADLTPDLTDRLTGLPNDRWLEQNIDDFVTRYGKSLAVLYIDGDGLKTVNDEYGHSEGDAYIKNMAGAITDSIRHTDIGVAVHKSGDEFVVLLNDIEDDSALALIVARIEQNLDEIEAPVSVGAARYREGDNGQTLINQADAALAVRKQERREASLSPEEYRAVVMAREVLKKVGMTLRAAGSFDDIKDPNDSHHTHA